MGQNWQRAGVGMENPDPRMFGATKVHSNFLVRSETVSALTTLTRPRGPRSTLTLNVNFNFTFNFNKAKLNHRY